jgi:N,N'-diacetylchitobiose transport system permease protein
LASEPGSITAGPAPRLARRRSRPWRDRLYRAAVPYALLSPATFVIAAVLGYPLYFLVRLSFERYGLAELIAHRGVWVGFDNYTSILHDHQFWVVLARTVAFTAVNVGATMLFGTLIALLLTRLGSIMRLVLSTGLVLVWAMPVIVATNIWGWMVDYEFGVANWLLTELHVGNFQHHDWFANPISGLGVIAAVIVWGAIPFVAITVYAGLSQLPQELVEAASIDGAGAWRRFRDITVPILKPIFVIVTSLSIIWDFQVFVQIFVMRDDRPTDDYFTMAVYAYEKSFGVSQYGLGSAIALVMVLIMLCVTFVYIREMVRIGEVS